MKVLSLSPSVPYDTIAYAGGQTYNYYMKVLAKIPDFELRIVALCKNEERAAFDCEHYGITYTAFSSRGGLCGDTRRILWDIYGMCIYHKNILLSFYKRHLILRAVSKMKKQGYRPDVVILEWTAFVMLARDIRDIFPDSRIVGSEHDVSFLGAERIYKQARGLRRSYLFYRYRIIQKQELKAIEYCNMVMPHNDKDKYLLMNHGVLPGKIHVLVPFFHDMRNIKREDVNKDILFWGAMNRIENCDAAIWFIEKVMPLLKDTGVRFVAVGNKPSGRLKAMEAKNIVITGFVADVVPYFQHSMVFVAPLQLGAGIKVKIIEALSSGIPVITNSIGIEGIPAQDGVHYFHCETPEKYAAVIRKFLECKIALKTMELEQKKMISNYFDLKRAADEYTFMLRSLCAER